MSCELRKWIFIGGAFLLGSINGLYNIEFYIFLVLAFLVNLVLDFKGCITAFKQEWKYLAIPMLGVIYLILHYIVSLIFVGENGYKPSWSTVELILLYFFFIPLYLLSARSFVTPLLLRRFLFSLCWGILLFNFVKLFYITGSSLFTDTGNALKMLYAGRFGGNMRMLGGFIYLEPQAIYICVSTLIAYFFLLKQFVEQVNKSILWQSCVILIFSLLFLSFTVTKGTILATIAGIGIVSIFYFLKMNYRRRLFLGSGLLILFALFYFAAPMAYTQRLKEMKNEITGVHQGDFKGGSIGPRAGLMKENFSHIKEFGLFGLGVYKKPMTREWYKNSPYLPGGITNAHNSFMEFWLRGGILGLVFIFYYFFAPVFRMRKLKKYSFLIIAMIVALFIANNTCVLIILVDSCPFVVMMLAMAYLYLDRFIGLESNDTLLGR